MRRKSRSEATLTPLIRKPRAGKDATTGLSASNDGVKKIAEGYESSQPFPDPSDITDDHPFAQLFGIEKTRQLVSGESARGYIAKGRRAVVRELSLKGWRAEDIASELGVSRGTIKNDRAKLRSEGSLHRLNTGPRKSQDVSA